LDLLFVVRVAGTGLDVIKNVVFSEPPVIQNVYRFDQALILLGVNRSRGGDGMQQD